MQLTRNFTRAEFDVSGVVPPQFEGNVIRLANLLQWFRDLAGVPARLTSVYRDEAHNDAVGGAPGSQHETASAADVDFEGITTKELTRRLLAAEASGSAPLYGQFIVYNDDGHVHVSLPHNDGTPDRQKLVANTEQGHRVYSLIDSLEQIVTQHRAATVLLLIVVGLAFFFPLAH